MKILVIEDDVPVAETLMGLLRADGYEVAVAHSGEDGLRHVEREFPDAVFLDVGLPKMSGVEVLRTLRAQAPSLPVFVLTGHATASDLLEIRRLGANDVIMKPAILQGLTDALASVNPRRDPV